MANITLSIPDKEREEMRKFSDIRWSEVARTAIIERLETLKLTEKIINKSKLTKKDIEEFNKKIKSSATKKFLG